MSLEEQLKIYEFINIFIKNDFNNASYYCYTWNGTNGIYFREKRPEDFVLHILELVIEGKRKVYLESYNTFKNSIYYHLKNEMLTYFKCRKKLVEEENPHYINVDDSKIVPYDDDINYENNNDPRESEILNYVENNEIKEKLLNLIDPENELEEWLVLNAYLEGKKREEIAEDLGISVNEVTNIKKRIIRKLKRRLQTSKRRA
ncbi:sigma-70 family RNA polymerase sigma factor [Ignavibacteria bacterium 4148-Me]|uniref:sigma-70 family RNA polymerase sigma factor n=1 Tax=Rosettibacter primus TaxID=3111523 RepID=UPI00336BE484